MRLLKTPLPLAYVHMISVLAKVNNLLIAIAFGFKLTLDIHYQFWLMFVIHASVVCASTSATTPRVAEACL